MPAAALARGPYNDKQNPKEYTDTEDGQPLKMMSYVIAPIGYALEWGVARPLHYLATETGLAPMMSGDTEYSEIYNPDTPVTLVPPLPPDHSASAAMPSHIEPAPASGSPAAAPQASQPAAPVKIPYGQPALH